MELLGVGVGQLLALFGAAAVVTVALYLLELRRRRVRVPFVALWTQASSQTQATRLFSKLRHVLSLLLALAIVAALTLALGDPRATLRGDASQARLLLIDTSVSMGAVDAGKPRMETALEQARAVIDELPKGQRLAIARADHSAIPITAATDDAEALTAALSDLRATSLPLHSGRLLTFARNVLGSATRPELVLVSDFVGASASELGKELARSGIALRSVVVGRAGRNVGVSAFAVRRYPLDKSHSQAFLELHNGGSQTERVELTLLSDGRAVEHETLELPGAGRMQRTYQALAGTDRRVEAVVRLADGAPDALAADDRAVALLPKRQRTRVLAVTEGNLYLEAALLLDEYLDVDTLAPAQYRGADGYDVVIFDRFVPSTAPRVPGVYLAPQAPGAFPLVVAGELSAPYFVAVNRSDPLLRFTALEDVNISRALKLQPAPGDQVLGRDASGAPLLLRGAREGVPFVALAFDVRDSDLPLRIAWPVLVVGMVDSLVSSEVGYLETHAVGDRVVVPVAGAAVDALVTSPDGRRTQVAALEGTVQVQSDRTGFLSVTTGGTEQLLAFNLRPETPRSVTPSVAASPAPPQPAAVSAPARWLGSQPPWLWLVSAVALVLIVEWFTYQRRWTL